MISMDQVVRWVLYLLGAGLIFGLLHYLIDYTTRKFPAVAPFASIAKIGLVILAVLVLIGLILSFMGSPVFRVGP